MSAAYARRVHCLNVVRTAVRTSSLATATASLSLTPLALRPDRGPAALGSASPGDTIRATGRTTGTGASSREADFSEHPRQKTTDGSETKVAKSQSVTDAPVLADGSAPSYSRSDGEGTSALAALALAAAVRSSRASVPSFPLRNAATLLLVASVKRLAGKDNDVGRRE